MKDETQTMTETGLIKYIFLRTSSSLFLKMQKNQNKAEI